MRVGGLRGLAAIHPQPRSGEAPNRRASRASRAPRRAARRRRSPCGRRRAGRARQGVVRRHGPSTHHIDTALASVARNRGGALGLGAPCFTAGVGLALQSASTSEMLIAVFTREHQRSSCDALRPFHDGIHCSKLLELALVRRERQTVTRSASRHRRASRRRGARARRARCSCRRARQPEARGSAP